VTAMSANRDREPRDHVRLTSTSTPTEKPVDDPVWPGIPPLGMQQLWFSIQRLEWSSLVVVPAGPGSSALDFGRPLYQVARLTLGDRIRLLDARGVMLTRIAPLILDMAGASEGRSSSPERKDRVLVLLESVLSHPPGVPIALAADAALLCVEMGTTTLAAARETIQLIGAQRFVGCVTLPPLKR